MQRNLDQVLPQIDGEPFRNVDKNNQITETPLTLGNVVFNVSSLSLRGDEGLELAAKMRLYGLAKVAYHGGTVDLSAEDIATIKERVGRAYGNFVLIGAVIEALETDPVA